MGRPQHKLYQITGLRYLSRVTRLACSVPCHDTRSTVPYDLLAADQNEQMLEVVQEDAEQRALLHMAARNLARRIAGEE